ncbi:MAG: type II toxin-antitoxin system VapC family toxin [Limisphaerales bacterium]
MRTVCRDANVFNALFGNETGREACARIEKAARDGTVEIYTSTVTFVECIKIKGKRVDLKPEHEEIIRKYFQHKFIKPINCDRKIAELSRALIWQHSHLKPYDAIHVASAISQQVDVLHSYDNDDLVKLDGKIGKPPLKICYPENDEGFAEPPNPETLL